MVCKSSPLIKTLKLLFINTEHHGVMLDGSDPKSVRIKVDQVRELCARLALRSFRGAGKVAIIDPADRMNINANNALLKTLPSRF